jgi:peptidoglycan/xylan/chitin deacetylase (PgdA/CDA1 family)
MVIAGLALALAACGGGSSTPASTPAKTTATAAAHGHAASTKPAAGTPVSRRTVAALVAPAGAPSHSVQVPVLTYHRVHTMPAVGQPDLIVDPATFASELQALSSGGYHTITQAQLFDAMYKGAALPAKPVMISVDDGYVDDVRTVLPDLQRFHMVATFFVITGRTTEPGFVTEAQIRELDRAGMDVGDHTAHHVDLNLLSASQLRSETTGSRQRLQAILGHPVYFFAYPFGAYNDTVVRAISAAGFTLAYTTAGGTTESTSAPLTMPRIHVGRSETASGLVSLLGGA